MKRKLTNIATILTVLALGSACSQGNSGKANEKDNPTAVKEGIEIVENDTPLGKTDLEEMGLSGKVKHIVSNQNQGPQITGIDDGGDSMNEYFFNEAGNIVKQIHNEAGTKETTLYTYDTKNHIKDIEVKDEDGGKWSTHYNYQKKGDNTVVTYKGLYSDNTIEEVYNNKGLLTSKLDGDTRTTYNYNNSGKLLEVKGGMAITYQYDNDGHLVKEDIDGLSTIYIYDNEGNLKEKREDAFYYNPDTDVTTKLPQEHKTIYKRDNGKLSEKVCDYGKHGKIVTKYNNDEKIVEIAIGETTYRFEYAPNGGLKQVVDCKGNVAKFDPSKETKIEINPVSTTIQSIEYYK